MKRGANVLVGHLRRGVQEKKNYVLLDFWAKEEKILNDQKKRQIRKTPVSSSLQNPMLP